MGDNEGLGIGTAPVFTPEDRPRGVSESSEPPLLALGSGCLDDQLADEIVRLRMENKALCAENEALAKDHRLLQAMMEHVAATAHEWKLVAQIQAATQKNKEFVESKEKEMDELQASIAVLRAQVCC